MMQLGGKIRDGEQWSLLICSGLMTQTQEIVFKPNKKLFYCEDGYLLEKVAQRSCGNVQNMMGPEQPTLTAPAISRGLGLNLSRSAFKPQLPVVQCYTLLSCTQAFVPSSQRNLITSRYTNMFCTAKDC